MGAKWEQSWEPYGQDLSVYSRDTPGNLVEAS